MPSEKRLSPRRLVVLMGLIALSTTAMAQQPRVLRVISDRTDEGTLRPILEAYEAKSGAKIEGIFMDQGLVNRLESRPTEAEVRPVGPLGEPEHVDVEVLRGVDVADVDRDVVHPSRLHAGSLAPGQSPDQRRPCGREARRGYYGSVPPSSSSKELLARVPALR